MTYARPANREKLSDAALLKRFGLSEEMARPVLFLVCDDSSFITGQKLFVDGGMNIYLNTNNKKYNAEIWFAHDIEQFKTLKAIPEFYK